MILFKIFEDSKMHELTKVAVLFGGVSPEHDVSIMTGVQAFYALDQQKYSPIPVYIDLKGNWWTGTDLIFKHAQIIQNPDKLDMTPVIMSKGGLLNLNKKNTHIAIDVCLLALHGGAGENGGVQGLCDLFDIPYTGLRQWGAAVAMNKWVCKNHLKEQGVHVLPGVKIDRPSDISELNDFDISVHNIDFPVCVKPCSLGSSIGVGFAQDQATMLELLMSVFEYDDMAIIEPAVKNLKEFNVAVLRQGDEFLLSEVESPRIGPIVSSPGDAEKTVEEWLDFKKKYRQGSGSKKNDAAGLINLSREFNPDMPTKMRTQLERDAKIAFDACGGYGAPRIDFLADMKKGQIWLNEVNAIPGSFGYYLWHAQDARMGFVKLLDHLVQEALHMPAPIIFADPVPVAAQLFKR